VPSPTRRWHIDPPYNEPALREFSTLIHGARATLFARVAITADDTPRVLPPRDGTLLKTRFRRATGAEP